MYLGKVVGMVVATRKDDTLVGKKLMIVQPVNPKEEPMGSPEVAIDSVGSGVGEYVLVSKGSPARQIFGNPNAPIDAAIVGIIDTIEVSE
ncbi:Carboxysome shell and ethanolamine utilization microcompartment protein CcmK/EutM [Geosporobacter subterraneus DSM 17957]|uniref:Carboxysome shell and ethanolamine utilization microcompartment protein CcmK/EutM n=1 Tax=Geosporobacter subterraneus DSM 17957 TaxID=1121919 RepID=A0A1M6HU86_9FIRM|nr:EutN/CcmL family microcompartment protein [Geosporobacter subterraneus]SHJ25720.1 Carboxysome shell and ethanolamine utilization microcompartment protein CcmK/EutM [Geosporobacter subterraneus DSM 17957]